MFDSKGFWESYYSAEFTPDASGVTRADTRDALAAIDREIAHYDDVHEAAVLDAKFWQLIAQRESLQDELESEVRQ